MFRYRYSVFVLLLIAMPLGASGMVMDGDRLLVQTSLWTKHFNPEPDHTDRQALINVEWHAPADLGFKWQEEGTLTERAGWLADVTWLVGAATFRNSFAQRGTYVYGGGRYDLYASDRTRVYAKVTAGLLHGYRGEHRNKIPFNRHGVAPAILPAVGVEHRRLNLEMIPFGTAGVMFNIGFYLN